MVIKVHKVSVDKNRGLGVEFKGVKYINPAQIVYFCSGKDYRLASLEQLTGHKVPNANGKATFIQFSDDEIWMEVAENLEYIKKFVENL